ncbi:MAG: ABC transporter permease [Bacilli bacterium]
MLLFKELYQYRELLKSNIKKEIRGKYKGSFLGVLWSFVSPLLMVLVYSFIFPLLMGTPDDYVVYLVTGILPWTFFAGCVSSGTITVILNANLIKKVYFPREVLPISVVLSGAINFVISCIVIFIFLLTSGIGLSGNLVYFPLILLIQVMFSLGVTFILAAINVYIRDIEYIMNFIILLLMYLTPILWEVNMITTKAPQFKEYVKYLFINPMAGIIDSYHQIFYYKSAPNSNILLYTLVISVVLMIVGYFTYRKLEKGFAEEL